MDSVHPKITRRCGTEIISGHVSRVTGAGGPLRVVAASFAMLLATIVSPTQAAPLNDTGITTFGDASSNTLATEPADYPGQDASYGRDAAATAGTLSKIGGGSAGFDFTKLGAGGNELPASATSWSCVRDNVTGLIWEVKTNDGGLRDKDNTYTWYNPDGSTNGGSAGTQNGGTCAGSACDTYSYAQAVNSQGLCGYSDWRLPWQEELRSIVDYSIPYPGPAIDTAYFPNTNYWFWSASPYAGYSDYAWDVSFILWQRLRRRIKSSGKYVRLVRGGQ
ncbi:MAG TPA: DUF1566 domain-containing protein [Gammaproteobacteria bacterium]|nr:DUF1566 domain-containing protein [Gammaproteobacteria bacterium]